MSKARKIPAAAPARNAAGNAMKASAIRDTVPSPMPARTASGSGAFVVSSAWAIPAAHASATVSSP